MKEKYTLRNKKGRNGLGAGVWNIGPGSDPFGGPTRASIPILDRLFSRELKAVIALYDELKPVRATTDVSYAAHAATAGAIDQLLVDFDAVVPGLVSDIDGSVIYSASDDAGTYSVVDEVARRALFTGARVMGARREELPDRAPLTAILRYAFH